MSPASDVEVEVSPDRVGRGRRGGLSLDDCRCPVCLEIFIEPVTLPCTHTFCKVCFLESVDKATLCCPMCRKRVSTWARQNSRNQTLVNQQLWTQIQICFPLQCERRLAGQEDQDDPGVSQPGELRQEYEDQVTKLTEEKRVLEEEQRRASEEYIQRLLAEEEQLLQEESRRREEDERLARMLSTQLNSSPVSQDLTPAKKKKEVGSGQIEKFLFPLQSKSRSPESNFMANKENILLSQEEQPPPKLDYYGAPTDRSEPPDLNPDLCQVEDQTLRRDRGSSSTKRKSSELETEEEEIKRGFPSSSSSSSSSSSLGVGVSEWESELVRRRHQEEEDRRLALLLQRELDQEEKQRATDRRKGSADAYQLRQTRGGRGEASSRPPRKTAKTSSSSSSSSSRGSKQTTLTEMFSSLTSSP
ncbi:E3 ubiquitin-protein ligase rnf168 isoform X2 [Lates calcarifer]|uniref:RING-type E3 ubiquitin transferase n=1 Tax=Lates calcarifer TaxID=8187 RepID=A0AAJ7QN78_LATCA|nr:E3 ubiquitin-protein ligase rnf168 isoform X2 [Lates calcarifer]